MPPEATTGAGVRAQTSLQQSEIGAAERAVLGHVGDDVARAAGGVEPVDGLPEVPAVAGPAPSGQRRTAHVEADRHGVTEPVDHRSRPLRVLESGRAQVDPAAAGGQGHRQGLVVADAAGELHRDVEPADDVGQLVPVGPAPERRVEVDQVDPLGAGLLPGQRGGQRVAVVRLAAGLALHQPDGLSVGDVDRWEQHQAVGHDRRDQSR